MSTKSYYEGISHIVHISNDEGKSCEHCSFGIGNNLAKSVNHYINDHEYKLLHVGQETSRDMAGNPHQLTVAILGK